ncbi:aspartic peptidase domain-containing protein [Mycena maculata]|uniref:Aspartic peptidase domain-containing protein n=1 Tax=Mycena maculata TaxID=230809 RepID=A0AAD7HR67_9AGAR|nr:aspartic peptidase domain-containing protein [Mycena maculata]
MSSAFQELSISSRQYVTALASTSGQGYENDIAYEMERRELSLNDALPGLLHTVEIGTYREDPAEDVTFSRLAVDTGSVVTWIFGEHPTLIQEGNAIERDFVRIGRKGYYTTGATQNPGEHLTIPYLEGSAVNVDLYTGPFYLRGGLKPDGSSFYVCRSPNFIFGVATAASSHFERRRIDGILGLGFRKTGRPQIFVNSLYQEDLIERDRFTIALGKENQTSYLIVGDNTGTAVQLNGAWSAWIPAVSSSMHWMINLESLVIGDETHDMNLRTIIDTGVWTFSDSLNFSNEGYLFAGTTYSYLPRAACEFLHKALGGQGELSSKSLYARVQQNMTVNFKFSGVHIVHGLADLLDPRPNTGQGVQGGPSAYGAFKPMRTAIFERIPQQCCILGNFFLRGLVVEFERTNYGTGGRVRFASRANDI